MDLTKSYDYFKPESVMGRVHIVGCGSVGSTIAENLARSGVTKMTLWDFDKVEGKNIVNQMFVQRHIGQRKVDALKDILVQINPDCEADVQIQPEGWTGKILSGYIFLCVDNIELRKEFVEKHLSSQFVKAMFDVRTLLTGAQHYAADWSNEKSKEYLLSTMQFSHDEAAEETPTSACGVTLGVCQTVRIICGFAVSNFVNFINTGCLKKFIQYGFDKESLFLDAFDA